MRADGNAIGDRVPLQLIHWVFIRLVQYQIAVRRPLAQSAVGKALHASTMTASPSMKVLGEKEDGLGVKACVIYAWISDARLGTAMQ